MDIEARIARLEHAVAMLLDDMVSRLDSQADEYGGGATLQQARMRSEFVEVSEALDKTAGIVRCQRCGLEKGNEDCWHAWPDVPDPGPTPYRPVKKT
jgi:hypothetical protein